MIGEIDLGGVFIPAFFVCAVVAFVLSLILRKLLRKLRFYRLVWHAGLFDVGLFVLLWCFVSMASVGLTPFFGGVQ
jgi:hypothetical protein